MKLFTPIAFAASLFALTMAQSIDIGAPLSGTSVLPGQNITVEVDRPVRAPDLSISAATHLIASTSAELAHRLRRSGHRDLDGSL